MAPLTRDEQDYDLVRSFMIASAIVVVIGMGGIGYWLSDRIGDAASRNAAAVAALYVDGVAAPATQVLLKGPDAAPAAMDALDERLGRGLMNAELFAFKVWKPDGAIAYASDRSQVGQRFPVEDGLAAALRGEIHTALNDLDEAENRVERAAREPLLEVYSPIRDPDTGEIIGVFEFYDRAAQLKREIEQARLESWIVVGVASTLMLLVLSGVILRGGRLIDAQRKALNAQIATLAALLDQNRTLSARVDQANRGAVEASERQLRQISADIHDGPLQLLAFAALRLDGHQEMSVVRDAVDQSAGELRQISRGLVLPELQELSTVEIISRAVAAHEGRTGATIQVYHPASLPSLPQAEKICLYRFLQEALGNTHRHAGDAGVVVEVDAEGDRIVARVADQGPGFDLEAETPGLGLSGLRDRIAGLGGSLKIDVAVGGGASLVASLPLEATP